MVPTGLLSENLNNPAKIRLVWDLVAEVNRVSLNSILLKGPDQLASLHTILYVFIEKCIAIRGDIREMFYQVRVPAEERNSQRFLWRDNDQEDPDVYVMQVITFGAPARPLCPVYKT